MPRLDPTLGGGIGVRHWLADTIQWFGILVDVAENPFSGISKGYDYFQKKTDMKAIVKVSLALKIF